MAFHIFFHSQIINLTFHEFLIILSKVIIASIPRVLDRLIWIVTT